MYTVLLSGGSGKRLWPISGPMRSKQYLMFLKDSRTGEPCSMVQRVWAQLEKANLAGNCIVCADRTQKELLRKQLGGVRISEEPEGRDTFPAVALSCAYLKSRLHAKDDDIACILPVDPYAEQAFFESLKLLPSVLESSGASIVLMGVRPSSPSGKYGYIVPLLYGDGYFRVRCFQEKPGEEQARDLIARGALWNCGVFCLKIGTVLKKLAGLGLPGDYDELYRVYEKLPAVSFDYEILEKSKDLVAVPFDGMWKDLGTWGAFAEIMEQPARGECFIDSSCSGARVVNETQIPVVALGLKDQMVVASYDGILVTDKNHSSRLKQIVSNLPPRPGLEESYWGAAVVLDYRPGENGYLVRRVRVHAGQKFGPKCREGLGEVWTVLSGSGRLVCGETERRLRAGDAVPLCGEEPYSLSADTELLFLQARTGG
ncbi:sugar phosphate nucleotidyltransferase [Caproicibacter sp. BJN0012]|nr:sugar phosphate nucleotidyltransferase [Caproicibacter sp. BJN0012]